jgi:nucleoid DNA-binding protein
MIVLDIHGAKPVDESGEAMSFGSIQEVDEKDIVETAVKAFNEALAGGYRCEISARGLFDIRTYAKESV